MRFSLRTLMIAAIVLPLLMAGAVWGISYARASRCKISDIAVVQIATMRSAVNIYYLHTGELPSDLESLIVVPPLGDPKKWQGPYLEENSLPLDPWNNPFRYEILDPMIARFRISSKGPDGIARTRDDITYER